MLRPDLHLITAPASNWSVQLLAVLWLADTVPSDPWQPGSDLWIWSALSRLIRAYLSTLCPHCYHTLSLSPVPAASLIDAQETEGLSLAFCHNSHFLAKQMSKVYCENKGSSLSIIYILKLILLLLYCSLLSTTAWKQTLLASRDPGCVIVILLLVTVSQECLQHPVHIRYHFHWPVSLPLLADDERRGLNTASHSSC